MIASGAGKRRAVDHLVLPVADLNTTREQLETLGFTVANDARHPFGTVNACVFFADGTYLEPLAVGNPEIYRAAVDAGNPFVRKDALYRESNGFEGFSAVVAASTDALSDNDRYIAHGFSDGRMLDFSRPVTLPDGSTSQASFRLAFAAGSDPADFFLFSCQRIVALPGDRAALERHANGVTGTREILLSAQYPELFLPLVAEVFGVDAVHQGEEGILFGTPNVLIRIVPRSSLLSRFGIKSTAQGTGLRGAGVVFAVGDLSVTEALLAANGVAFTRKDGRLLVQAAPGQGALFAFEE